MNCPKCSAATIATRFRDIEIDNCSRCAGVWFDANELEQLLAKEGNRYDKTRSHLAAAELVPGAQNQPLRCPRCGGALLEREVGGSPPVRIDRCEGCAGIFLDANELDMVRDAVKGSRGAEYKERAETVAREQQRMARLTTLYGTRTPVASSPTYSVNGFIAKVYNLLTLSVLVSAVGAYAGTVSAEKLLPWVGPLFILEILVLLGVFALRRVEPINMVALFAFTFLSGLTLGPALAFYEMKYGAGIIWQALGLTTLLFGSLTLYVHKTNKDFSYLGGFLFVGLLSLLVGSIALVFLPSRSGDILLSVGGILLFSGFVLFDTSRVIHKYDESEYVAATIDLYLDIVNLFLDILRLLARARN